MTSPPKVTDKLVERYIAEATRPKWNDRWGSKEAVRACLEAALNPQRRYTDTVREERRKDARGDAVKPAPTPSEIAQAQASAALALQEKCKHVLNKMPTALEDDYICEKCMMVFRKPYKGTPKASLSADHFTPLSAQAAFTHKEVWLGHSWCSGCGAVVHSSESQFHETGQCMEPTTPTAPQDVVVTEEMIDAGHEAMATPFVTTKPTLLTAIYRAMRSLEGK